MSPSPRASAGEPSRSGSPVTLTFFGRSRAIRVRVFAKTDVGRSREHNEDNFLVADLTRREASLKPSVREHVIGERGSLFMVADGMGGAAAGEQPRQRTAGAVEHVLHRWQQLCRRPRARAPGEIDQRRPSIGQGHTQDGAGRVQGQLQRPLPYPLPPAGEGYSVRVIPRSPVKRSRG